MRLIDADKLLKEFSNKGIHIEFDLPVEEILGEDIDLDDFTMLMQDGVMAYKSMVIDTIKNQPIAYAVDKVVEELDKQADKEYDDGNTARYSALCNAIDIVKAGGKNDD